MRKEKPRLDFAQNAHRVFMEAIGERPKTKPTGQTDEEDRYAHSPPPPDSTATHPRASGMAAESTG